MRKVFIFLFFLITFLLVIYVLIPESGFPSKIPGSLQSDEPADTETSLRRGYYTDLSRGEVLDFYQKEFAKTNLKNISLFSFRLNYPPEEAQTLIRDQTRSTFLQEIEIPFRESLYINGFEPIQDKDRIVKLGKIWRQKITVRVIPSSILVRLGFVIITSLLTWIVVNEILKDLYRLLHFKKYN